MTAMPTIQANTVAAFALATALGLAMIAGSGLVQAASYPAFADMGSAQAVEIGDRILSWQLPHGGWGKDLPIATTLWTPGRPKSLQQAGGVDLGSIDNGATTTEIRYLAHVYTATGEARFREGALKGIDFLLEMQYPSGGWPQAYPRRGNYSDEVTFNDDAMVRVMQLLREVASGEHPFGFVDDARRAASQRAFDLGIQYILNAQIEVDGRLTAWCAQHDPWTYEPKQGRPYEHPSISGAESVGIIRLLMALPDPDERVRRAILSALLWLDEVRLPDGRWARFYEIGTNRPIFSGRDGIVRYDIMEIEAERRHGYAWYGTWAQELLRRAWSDGTIAGLHASLPDFKIPLVSIVRPAEAMTEAKGDLIVEFGVAAHDPGAITRVVVSVDDEPVYERVFDGVRRDDAAGFRDAIVMDTTQWPDGRRSLEVTVEYAGGRVTRRRAFVVRNEWERRISMRAPEDHGWFGVVDHLRAVDRSDGWEFLVDKTEPPFGITYRLGWSGQSDEYLVWAADGLRYVELVVLSPAPEPRGLRIEVGLDDPDTGERRWQALQYWVVEEQEARGGRMAEDGWRLLRLVAEVSGVVSEPALSPQTPSEPAVEGPVSGQAATVQAGSHPAVVSSQAAVRPGQWLRIVAEAGKAAGPLQLGDLLLRGIS